MGGLPIRIESYTAFCYAASMSMSTSRLFRLLRVSAIIASLATNPIGCKRAKPMPPPPAPEGVPDAPAQPNVSAVTASGFQLISGKTIPLPAGVPPAVFKASGAKVVHVSEPAGPRVVRMNFATSAGAAAAQVERDLAANGWKRTGELRSGSIVHTFHELPDGGMSEIVAYDLPDGRSEVQLTSAPALPVPPR